MTTELVLLLAVYAFILLGAFIGPGGPIQTFKDSTPRLAAKLERDLATGTQFQKASEPGSRLPGWEEPTN